MSSVSSELNYVALSVCMSNFEDRPAQVIDMIVEREDDTRTFPHEDLPHLQLDCFQPSGTDNFSGDFKQFYFQFRCILDSVSIYYERNIYNS